MILAIFALFLFGIANAQNATSTSASAGETVVITVADVTSSNATSVFTPSQVTAAEGATVLFNFTQGNHTATESAFFAPCEPLNYTNGTNGFDSNFQVANVSASIFPIATVPILVQNDNMTMWFYDVNTCGEGGVGVINLVAGDPATSGQTLAGFIRNAIRLNGTTTTSSGPSSTGSSQTSSASGATQTNGAQGSFLGAYSSIGIGLLVGAAAVGLGPLVVL
jgi:plastocyanin